MALSLNPTLAEAQDAISRHPLCKITSSSNVADIPFDGQLVTSSSTDETNPNVIVHSSGRLIGLYTFGTGSIGFVYTNTDRTEFNFVTIDIADGVDAIDATLCELADGNIGVVYLDIESASYRLYRMVVSITGAVITGASLIASYSEASYWINAPWVIRLASGTYLLVYAHENGGVYTIKKRTSSDFLTWSAEGPCTIGGLSTALRSDYPSLMEHSGGTLFLFFAYTDAISGVHELTNIYYSTSSDNGGTWSAATKITAYDTFAEVGTHPIGVERAVDDIQLIYSQVASALHMDEGDPGWCSNGDYGALANEFSYDSVNQKLYVTNIYPGVGSKNLLSVVRIDLTTWTVDDCWNDVSTPAFNSAFFADHVNINRHHGESYLIPVGLTGTNRRTVAVLDGENETITMYSFANYPAHSITANVTGLPTSDVGDWTLYYTWVDFASMRLYCCLASADYYSRQLCIGYIDLTDPGPTYEFHVLLNEKNEVGQEELGGLADGDFLVLPDEDLVVVSMHTESGPGRLRVYTGLSDGDLSIYRDYRNSTYDGFPYRGLDECVWLNDHIYGSFGYESGYGQSARRGLFSVNVFNNQMEYNRPSWATLDDYQLNQMCVTEDDMLIITTKGYGVTIFDPSNSSWILHSSETLPGLTEDESDNFGGVAYDPTTGLIFTGQARHPYCTWYGVVVFSRYGLIKKTYYIEGAYSGGNWGWGTEFLLVQGIVDYEAAAVDVGGVLYAFWTNNDDMELSIKWDNEGATFNLANYLTGEVQLKRTIDGTPAELTFSVSHGHLFDPNNLSSLLSPYLKKGRSLALQFGDLVAGVEYWQDQGVYLITQGKLRYEIGTYPTMNVTAEDERVLWKDHEVIATELYDNDYPEDIIQDVLVTHIVGLVAGDFDLPVFDTRYEIQHQWLDSDVVEIIEDICTRFGYFIRIDMDGKISARKISNVNAVDHSYADLKNIVRFSPDDSYSNFVNQVTVVGEERDYIDTIDDEERIDTIAGTIGWWQGQEVHRVYYSKDKKRMCVNPRLHVLTSTGGVAFELAGKVSESVSAIDPDHKWCEVTIDVPQLVTVLTPIIGIGGLVGASLVADAMIGDSVVGFTWTRPVGTFITAMGIGLSLSVLSSITNYSFEIYACPLSKHKRTVQSTANDLEFQTELGRIVTKKIEEPLCISVAQCAEVAEQELLVATLQRRRVSFSKTAHLQDEEGDTVEILHPYGGQVMRIFVTDITRRYKPSAPGKNDGYFMDDINGWRIV